MFSSFVCERSVEYIIVADLAKKLNSSFEKILPFHFGKNREGSLLALQSMANISGRLITIFARRPKIKKQDGKPFMKINSMISDYARQSREHGIPVLFAMPDVNSLRDLSWSSECIWYDSSFLDSQNDALIDISSGEVFEQSLKSRVKSVDALSNSDVVDIANSATVFSWLDGTFKLGELREALIGSRLFGYPYKPVHFFLPCTSVSSW